MCGKKSLAGEATLTIACSWSSPKVGQCPNDQQQHRCDGDLARGVAQCHAAFVAPRYQWLVVLPSLGIGQQRLCGLVSEVVVITTGATTMLQSITPSVVGLSLSSNSGSSTPLRLATRTITAFASASLPCDRQLVRQLAWVCLSVL